jgi:hypothetical protein
MIGLRRFSGISSLRAAGIVAAVLLGGLGGAAPSFGAEEPHGASAAPATPPPASLKIKNGLALLDSDVLLKVYYYAYSGEPVDYSAILTANPLNMNAPKPVDASAEQEHAIDALINQAKAHPDILIEARDISLAPYDGKTGSFPINNRVFMPGAKFYFDNSPFHYFYANATAFRDLRPDAQSKLAIDRALANYEYFAMDIVGHVTHADAKSKAIAVDLRKVTLKNVAGRTLITRVSGS